MKRTVAGLLLLVGAVLALVMIQTWNNGGIGFETVEGIVSFFVVLMPSIICFCIAYFLVRKKD